jgi:hypothetical protein
MLENTIRKEILAKIKLLFPTTIAVIGKRKLEVKLYSEIAT